MLIEKYLPLYAPEVEAGVETPESTPPMNERPSDGPGSGRGALRQQLESAFEQDRKGAEPEETPVRRTRTKAPGRVAGGAEITPDPGTEGSLGEEGGEQPEVQALPPPEGFTKEAKAEWASVPPTVQAAVLKREQDMAKGVDELKRRQADIDQALQPRMDLIRRHGHTPAQAVNQLFSWFEALSANPKIAFPALADSFKFDLKQLMPQQVAPAPAVPKPEGEQPEAVTPAVQQYITGLEQKLEGFARAVSQQFGNLQNTFQQQSEAKTQEILNNWAKDKPHFEKVRVAMAHMLSSGMVQPLADGSADLDSAYDMALYALPDIRNQILTEQQEKAEADRQAKAEKEAKAQQDQASKARKASGSLSLGAPGAASAPQGKRPGKGKSVRESLAEAIEAVRS